MIDNPPIDHDGEGRGIDGMVETLYVPTAIVR